MDTIEMDMEKLELMNSVRANTVLLQLNLGWETDWGMVERQVALAVADLERERKHRAQERALELMRAAGRAMRDFCESIAATVAAFNEGFNERG